MPHPTTILNIWVLLLEPCHAKYHTVMGNVDDEKVDCVTWLHSVAMLHAYHLAYEGGSAQ